MWTGPEYFGPDPPIVFLSKAIWTCSKYFRRVQKSFGPIEERGMCTKNNNNNPFFSLQRQSIIKSR